MNSLGIEMNQQAPSAFIWSVADLLRGDYKQSDYGKVILPFTVLRRLDCVLEATKPAVLKEKEAKAKLGVNPEPFLLKKTGLKFFNQSELDLPKLLGDPDHIAHNLFTYVQGFSADVRDIFDHFEFQAQIDLRPEASAQIDQLTAEAVLSIERLRERRSVLISAAVTGQIDVRGLAPAAEQPHDPQDHPGRPARRRPAQRPQGGLNFLRKARHA
jgi:HsdM N-terminal domain